MMANGTIALTTRAKIYDTLLDKQANGSASSHPSPPTPLISNGSLQIEKPISNTVLLPPKGTLWKSTSIQVSELLRTTTLLNIWNKYLVLCILSNYFITILVSERLYC